MAASSGPNWKRGSLYKALNKHGITDTPFPMGFAGREDTQRTTAGRKLSFYGISCECNGTSVLRTVSHYPYSHGGPDPKPGGVSGSMDTTQTNIYLCSLPACLSLQLLDMQQFWFPVSPGWIEAALRRGGHVHTPPGAGKSNFRFVSLG